MSWLLVRGEFLEKVLLEISFPPPIKDKILKEYEKFKKFIIEARPPRIVIIARARAGQSSLINAVFNKEIAEVGYVLSTTGKCVWFSYQYCPVVFRQKQ